jgi:hypothetical protein
MAAGRYFLQARQEASDSSGSRYMYSKIPATAA